METTLSVSGAELLQDGTMVAIQPNIAVSQ
jgi:hypothetical protein